MSIAKDFTPARAKGKKRKTQTPARVLAAHAVDAALDKKARDITVIDMREVSGVADYFVICSAEADLQVKAIVEAVEDRIRDTCDERPWHTEGVEHRQWVLLDYVDVVVHIFMAEKRAFYDLERLWGDAPTEHVSETAESSEAVEMLRPASTT